MGDIGLVFAPESELFNYVQQGSTAFYTQSIRGAYQGFFDNNIQPDFVHIDHLSEYPVVYLPYPLMLKAESARKLAAYVRQGGTLISEGLPAYFGDHGKAGTVQPNLGLDEVFGARESYVEFTPDLLDKLTLTVRGFRTPGRYFLQAYRPAGGTAAGAYEDGRVAAVEHSFGKGRTLLVGSFPGGGYFLHPTEEGRRFFASLLEWAHTEPRLHLKGAGMQARLHTGAGGTYLWVVNPARSAQRAEVTLPSAFDRGDDLWGTRPVSVAGRKVTVEVGDRDVAVILLAGGEVAHELETVRKRVKEMKSRRTEPPQPNDKFWVQQRIKQMVDIDQEVRLWLEKPVFVGWQREARNEFLLGIFKVWGEIDRANTDELKGLLKLYRWFTVSEFGKETDGNAWLLVQHADHDRAFQQAVLDILTELYPKRETQPANYAYLWDRVAHGAGRKQRYGTQGRCIGPGVWKSYEIEDPAALKQRRHDLELMPMEEYRSIFRERHLCP
ncbi:MAG: beta-galactosidase trimerization domain-containing protein [Acidobacteria bacterium]|nr:beta-galactosidase trimerization domain-containing protein [Acidobacteriota bacterium]